MFRCLVQHSSSLRTAAVFGSSTRGFPVLVSFQDCRQHRTKSAHRTTSRGVFKPIVEREIVLKDLDIRRAKYSNRCYLWGGTHTGALGHDPFVRPQGPNGIHPRPDRRIPYKLRFSEKNRVFRVACGNGFTVFAAKPEDTSCQYRIFGTGINKDSQIGLQAARPGAPLELLTEPVPIILPETATVVREENSDASEENPKNVPFYESILCVAAGRAHTVIVTPKAVCTLGNNSFGQCGRPIIETEEYFGKELIHEVAADGLHEVVKAVCGLDHTFLLTKSGEVFACGWGADGQTGLGHYKSVGTFTKVGGDVSGERVVRLSCRADCVLALNEKGDLFGWGNNEYGQLLGATGEMQLHTPKHIKLNRKLVDVAAGGSSCFVLDNEGQVFSWGYGVLGVGPRVTTSRQPQLIPPTLFGANELNPDSRPIRLEAGMSDFGAITNKGELYTWGRNQNGVLGLGQATAQMFPLKVSISAEVQDISIGIDHMAVITKTYC